MFVGKFLFKRSKLVCICTHLTSNFIMVNTFWRYMQLPKCTKQQDCHHSWKYRIEKKQWTLLF